MAQINLNITNPGNYGVEEILGKYPCWVSKYIKWDNNIHHSCHIWVDYWNGVEQSTANYKIAVLMEPKTLCPHNYQIVLDKLNIFDLIFTTYPEDLSIHSKYRYYHGGSRSFIRPEERLIYNKSKNICSIVSHKNFLPGHILRHNIKNKLQLNTSDLIQYINPPMDNKASGLKDYRFELVIENEDSSFFSEKLIDSMLCGCIPIYWSSQDVSYLNIFDLEGIILFKDEIEFYNMLYSNYFTQELYESKLKAIKYNFEKAKEFTSFGDILWNAGLKDFLNLNNLI